MSTGLLADPLMLDDGMGGTEEVTAEELEMVRRIRARARQHQHSPYRKALLARVMCRTQTQADKIPLPGGGYQTYRLMAGRHERADQRDVEAARQSTQEMRKQMGPQAMTIDPEKHVFRPGDLVTPETDREALLIDQDPGKFRPVGPAGTESNVDALAAELARMKQEAGAREAAQAAEIDKLRAEVAEAKKRNK